MQHLGNDDNCRPESDEVTIPQRLFLSYLFLSLPIEVHRRYKNRNTLLPIEPGDHDINNMVSSMNRLRSFLVVAVMMLASSQALTAQGGPAVDITGKWSFTVTTDAGTGTPTVTLKQRGDSLTGHYSSQALGEADITGTVKDRKLTFKFVAEVQGTSLAITYTGSVESADALKGTVDIGGQASGSFTAKRQ